MVDTISLYRSPVRLVLHAAEATSPFSLQAIGRARKKVMAEIALNGDELVLHDVSYTRNDASVLLDSLTEEEWRMHCIIYTYPGLLHFLERQEFNNDELKKADAYLYDQRFVKTVSPYFAYAFNTVSGSLIRQEAFDQLVLLLNYQGYLLPDHHHEAFQKIRNYLDELSYTLRNLSWEKFIADESILHFVFSDDWRKSMNALPSSFNTLRDEIVDHLIQIVLRFQQKATWHYLHEVLVQLRGLDTNDFNRHEIARIDEVIYANTKLEGRNGKPKRDGEVSSGRFIWWGIWVVLMIIRAATCNDKSSSSYRLPDFTYTVPREVTLSTFAERKNEKFLLRSMDSMLHQKNAVVKPRTYKTGDQPFEFGDDPSSARNDSLLIRNETGLDAVFLYFKDIPNHSLSGQLPKLYSTFIRKGEEHTVYLLPGNGRVYFALGEDWGSLKKPMTVHLPSTDSLSRSESLLLHEFFRNGKGVVQKYLLYPLYIEHPDVYQDESSYRYINSTLRLKDQRPTSLFLSLSSNHIELRAKGSLTIKEDALADVMTKKISPPSTVQPDTKK